MTKTKPFKLKMTAATMLLLFSASPAIMAANGQDGEVLQLFVDTTTKQIFSEPGPNRVKMGDFKPAASAGENPAGIDLAEFERLEARQMEHEKKLDDMLAKSTEDSKDDVKVSLGKKGLEFETADGNFSMKIGGRMHADGSYHNNDDNLVRRGTTNPVEAVSGTEIRRSRIAISGTLYKDFDYIIEADFAGSNASVRDLFLNYKGLEPFEFTVGQQKHAISMEVQESSNDIMFNERSLVTALTLPFFDRAIGVNLKSSGKNWSAQGGLYGDSLDASGESSGDTRGDEGSGWGTRVTYAPVNTDTKVIHLGANLGQRRTNDSHTLIDSRAPRFRYRTTNMSDFALSDTGVITGLDDVKLGLLEASAMYGPLSVQSEFAKAQASREIGSDADFDAFYVQMGWTLTGESRTYKGSDGEFKRLKPKNNFSLAKGTWGAWELAARYDQLDLEDQDIFGGEQKRVSINLNWYLNENVRMLAGYSRAFDLDNAPVVKADGDEADDIDVFALRAQWAF